VEVTDNYTLQSSVKLLPTRTTVHVSSPSNLNPSRNWLGVQDAQRVVPLWGEDDFPPLPSAPAPRQQVITKKCMWFLNHDSVNVTDSS